MPYDPDDQDDLERVKARLRKSYRNVTDRMARTFAHAFNEVWKSGKNEGRAMASGYAAVNKTGAQKLPRRG